MASITLDAVTKTYDTGGKAVDALDLSIADGEFMVLVGPSGCGKSTALRMIAGLEAISSGRLLIDGRIANEASPRERNIAMVFQSYALYPHLTVAGNIGFGLKLRKVGQASREAKVREVADLLELGDLLDRKPGQLSGGQRQRVAMGRALVRSPNAFLMDEPLSNLDARLRSQMRAEIASLQQRTGVTTVYVTHDQVEAMTMGHRVAVLRRGLLQQLGAPRNLYDAPANRFVAGFIGSPAMNFLGGMLVRNGTGPEVRLGVHAIPIDAADWPGLDLAQEKPIIAGLRPEAFRMATEADTAAALPGQIAHVEDLGASLLVSVDLAGVSLIASPEDDDDAFAKAHKRLQVMFDGQSPLKAGEAIRLVPDAARLHLFDPSTGAALPRIARRVTR
jgi:multiple sugar transport system ATP-binding protein